MSFVMAVFLRLGILAAVAGSVFLYFEDRRGLDFLFAAGLLMGFGFAIPYALKKWKENRNKPLFGPPAD
ncbi:MAG: hypothetical protein A3I89_02435 [Candidatus Harrisonbacteria bacterium RIFCSPLOWO2_02_FULL_41_11]|uniref:Uncharacterized protein n=1 Tax=Candidatus Harrisonbacteria bacterium RIFCSPHIGHO2_02_FULL_42_16 TaxID=1798404 RepID=A0A1G1ZK85_9BACT|nr:MAG: hypothetical protein A3B92_00150 [Candidatus Harrisonbacteria bacterium RIFCSPHIGHO2_02_FULL_42_16]OGY66523.1 MAG: hypothetical protein A3I89_02435 [Candidatus Harrisonbacteria bacterium RIFCSPLOWO2_02_FULL_41_11]